MCHADLNGMEYTLSVQILGKCSRWLLVAPLWIMHVAAVSLTIIDEEESSI